jgi:hypothetical protein
MALGRHPLTEPGPVFARVPGAPFPAPARWATRRGR